MDKIAFQTNVPLEVALKFPTGRVCESQFGAPQTMFTTTEDKVFFVAEKVAAKIHGLRLQPGEPIEICKAEIVNGARKYIEWQVSKVGFAPGEQPDGTFAVPVVAGADVVKTPAPVMAALQQPINNGNGSSNGHSNGNGHSAGSPSNPHVIVTDGRPLTRLEGALKDVVRAIHATNEFAKTLGYAMPQFTSEDLRAMANTIMIGGRQ